MTGTWDMTRRRSSDGPVEGLWSVVDRLDGLHRRLVVVVVVVRLLVQLQREVAVLDLELGDLGAQADLLELAERDELVQPLHLLHHEHERLRPLSNRQPREERRSPRSAVIPRKQEDGPIQPVCRHDGAPGGEVLLLLVDF